MENSGMVAWQFWGEASASSLDTEQRAWEAIRTDRIFIWRNVGRRDPRQHHEGWQNSLNHLTSWKHRNPGYSETHRRTWRKRQGFVTGETEGAKAAVSILLCGPWRQNEWLKWDTPRFFCPGAFLLYFRSQVKITWVFHTQYHGYYRKIKIKTTRFSKDVER